MAAKEEERDDFYNVLGLKKDCTPADLRTAYKKLAMKWHPDRCSASGNLKYVEEAKKKFQAIQEAYSVLSDGNRRFLYDVGIYDCDDNDDQNGMGDFLNEMAAMMNQNKSNETNGNQSFEELQVLFEEIFKSDISTFDSSSYASTLPTYPSSRESCSESYSISNKRNSSDMNSGNSRVESTQLEGFCIGVGGPSGKHRAGESSRRKNTRAGRR